ncbi:hypothetical protein K438DRAFT_1787058 [Mycena galopus ATCC 62051]|nr:hypothetical protein K438DRAFT_1787058 [Mycena galopus ATCC 62051]
MFLASRYLRCRTKTTFNREDLRTWHRPGFRLPKYWSCDWPNWDDALEFHDGGISTPVLHEIWGVTGEVEPLAFVPNAPDAYFVFCAGGVYYFFGDVQLKRFEGPFADHDDFLRRLDQEIRGGGVLVEPRPGYFN